MSKSVKRHPACVDCKFYKLIGIMHYCMAPVWDAVQGKEVPIEADCYHMRKMGGECGKVGALYEAAS